ncbi:MAG: hypothetical protein HYV96_01990 [Opitutae bacterium]|nr:hypothetical protein [Opitutae bacterium]
MKLLLAISLRSLRSAWRAAREGLSVGAEAITFAAASADKPATLSP